MDEQPTRTRRQAVISDLISRGLVSSQAQLRALLADNGVAITQPTLSKDLAEIGAIRVRGPKGGLVYALSDDSTPGATLDRVAVDLLISAVASGNIVVIKTPSGAAQYFAAGLDKAGWEDVLGCVAGDDTVIVVTRDVDGGEAVANQLLSYQRRGA